MDLSTMNKETRMNYRELLEMLQSMSADELALVIEAANYELAQLVDEEQDKQEHDDMLAAQGAK